MLATINRLQLMLFHYVFAFEVMKERAEEAEKQAEHFAKLLAKVLGEASALNESVDRLVAELDAGGQDVQRERHEADRGLQARAE